ncbi:Uncharacterized protein TCM_036642 [Theobroma cacao]|uniref:Secreted protein n=1 Tax=Theobroma cacao TaxID=3641 RepID=A0A061FK52_THECC|nr:Uncharacterized protein TCM_036642 [Theobroma cacao]
MAPCLLSHGLAWLNRGGAAVLKLLCCCSVLSSLKAVPTAVQSFPMVLGEDFPDSRIVGKVIVKLPSSLVRRTKGRMERKTIRNGPNRRNIQVAHIARRQHIWKSIAGGGLMQSVATASNLGTSPKYTTPQSRLEMVISCK